MHFKILSAFCFNLDQSKILSSGNRLRIVLLLPIKKYMCSVPEKGGFTYVLETLHPANHFIVIDP